MLYITASEGAAKRITDALEKAGYSNGDKLTKAEIEASSDTLFFRGTVRDSKAKPKDFISWDILQARPVTADNQIVAYFVEAYIDLVTNRKSWSSSVRKFLTDVEKSLFDSGLDPKFSGVFVDEEDEKYTYEIKVTSVEGPDDGTA